MRKDTAQLGPSAAQSRIRLGNGLVWLNLLDAILILVILFWPTSVLRIVLSIPFLLFFPGYAIITAIFTKKGEISDLERVVFSAGLSVLVVALTGLALNFTRWGIRLEPVLFSTASLILIASIIAWLRQRRLTENERFGIKLNVVFSGWVNNARDKALTIVLVIVTVGALAVLVFIAAVPRGELFTEFYILGQQGQSGDYADKLNAGDEGKVMVGIINHERTEVSYSVEVVTAGSATTAAGPLALSDTQNWEGEVSFTAMVPGDNQEVEFLLYREGVVGPYRQLHLWINVSK